MTRLVFVTQSYDPASTILGVTRDWVAALASRCTGVDVVAASAPPGVAAPPNVKVISLGKERRASRARQTARLAGALATLLPRAGAVLVHMVPRYALVAVPIARLTRRPLALWYAQGGAGWSLRLAAPLVDHILTPTRDSFPLFGRVADQRITITGHGIDTERYRPDTTTPAIPPRLLGAGRLSPAKRYDLLLAAAARLPHRRWHLRIAGPPLYASDHAHAADLRRRAADLGIDHLVDFAGAVPYEAMPAEYRAAWVLAHTSATGSLDKVVLEAMACGTPPVSTAPASRTAFGPLARSFWCPRDDPATIAEMLAGALDWSAGERADLGDQARAAVVREHSLATWAGRVAGLLGVDQGRPC